MPDLAPDQYPVAPEDAAIFLNDAKGGLVCIARDRARRDRIALCLNALAGAPDDELAEWIDGDEHHSAVFNKDGTVDPTMRPRLLTDESYTELVEASEALGAKAAGNMDVLLVEAADRLLRALGVYDGPVPRSAAPDDGARAYVREHWGEARGGAILDVLTALSDYKP